MGRGPDSTPLTPGEVASLERLNDRLRGIPGWLGPREAWELYRSLRGVHPDRSVVAVEIGNWKGRSTVALGLALKDRGAGTLYSVDPHVKADHRHAEVVRHVAERGVDPFVRVIRSMSHEARTAVPGPVSFLFVDGAHDYRSVLRDVVTWTPALAPGAVVAFNDPMTSGVNRVLMERVAVTGSPFRSARLVANTLFTEFHPDAEWTADDHRRMQALRRMLRWALWFTRLRTPVERFGTWPMRREVGRFGARLFYRLYPDVDLYHFSWLQDETSREGPG